MNQPPKLSDHELHGILINALHCAAGQYAENAKALREIGLNNPAMKASHDRLAGQFDLQEAEARRLAERLEEESAEA